MAVTWMYVTLHCYINLVPWTTIWKALWLNKDYLSAGRPTTIGYVSLRVKIFQKDHGYIISPLNVNSSSPLRRMMQHTCCPPVTHKWLNVRMSGRFLQQFLNTFRLVHWLLQHISNRVTYRNWPLHLLITFKKAAYMLKVQYLPVAQTFPIVLRTRSCHNQMMFSLT